MSDKRKSGVQALARKKGLFITLTFVLFHVLSANGARAPLVESITFMMDAGTHYSGNLGFKDPQAMVITSTNQWIIADKSNHRLIITDSTGSSATIVGTTSTQDTGPGNVGFSYPSALAIANDDNILVADSWNSRIQILDKTTFDYVTEFSTYVSGVDTNPASLPYAFWYLTASNELWVADSANSNIKKFDVATGNYVVGSVFTKPISSGSEFNAELLGGIAVDQSGNIYVCDDLKIDQFDSTGTWVQDVQLGIGYPQGITFDDMDRMVVCDTENDRVLVLSHDASNPYVWTLVGTMGSNGVAEGELRNPRGVYFDSATYYVVDTLNNRIQWFDQATFSHTTGDVLAQPAPATGELKAPMGIAYDSANQVLFVTNSDYDRVELFSVDNSYRQATAQAYYGSYALDYGTTNANKFNNPAGLSIGQDNKLYVADTDNNRILSFEYPGGYTLTPDQAYAGPGYALSVPQKATQCGSFVFVANRGTHQVAKYDLSGTLLANIPSSPAVNGDSANGHFYNPFAIACGIEASEIVVVDQGNNRVQVLDYDLNWKKNIGLAPFSGVGTLTNPVSVTIIDDRYWVLQQTQVTVFDTDGTPLLAFLSEAELDDAHDMAYGEGYLFIADTGNNAVHVYCAGLPVINYNPDPVVYMGVPLSLDLAVVTGGIGSSYTTTFGPSIPPGLTVSSTTTTKTDDTIHITGSATAPGIYNITATVSDSNGCSVPLFFLVNISDAFPFELTSYEPVAQVPTSGNQNVTIYGLFDLETALETYPNFTLTVWIGGNECLETTWNSSGIICLAPEGAGYLNTIYGEISEPSRNLFHSSTSTYLFSYKPPTITDITQPPTGFPIMGEVITVTGDSFGQTYDLDTVWVKGLECTNVITITPHYKFSCILPYGAGNLNSLFLEVGTTALGRLNTSTPLFFERPDVSCTTPGQVFWAGVSTNGGNDLVICGYNFGMYELGQPNSRKRTTLVGTWEGVREVYVKNRKCEITFVNDTLIHCTIPAGAGTHNKVWLNINSDLNSWLLLDIYVHYPRPILTHVVPSRALVPGMQITVYGKNFAYYAPEAKKTVTLGDNDDCTHVNVLNDGELTCIVTTGSGDNQPVVVTVADQRSIPILTVDFKDHFTAGLACEAPFGAQNPWFDNREMCNCFSGYAPSDAEQTDCRVAAVCPGHELSLSVASQWAPQRPMVAFANDRLELIQIAPIVKDRRDVHIRFEIPQNTLGIRPGKPGAESCWYPGVLWTKTVDALDCQDVYHITMPWSQQALCGFIQDSNPASTNVEFKSELVTEWRDIIMERGQLHQKLRSVAYLVTVQFIRQLKISSGSVSVLLADPTFSPIDVTITSGVFYDPAIQNILFTFVTTVEYPYQIDTSVPLYASYAPTVPGNVTVYAIASSPQPGNLQCDLTSSSLCEQEWQAVMIPGATTCTIQGGLVFNTSQLQCRDVDNYACPSTGDYQTSFTLFTKAIRVCDDDVLDATAQTTASIMPYSDAEFTTATSSFSVGDTAYFALQVIDPLQTIDSVMLNEVTLQEDSNPAQTLYSLSPAILVTGIHLNYTNKDSGAPVPPGVPVMVPLHFDLNRAHLTAMNGIEIDGATSLIVTVTLDVNYHGNQKRQISFTAGGAANSVSAATPFNVVLTDNELLENNLEEGQLADEFAGDEFNLWASGTTTLHTTTTTAIVVALCSALLMLF